MGTASDWSDYVGLTRHRRTGHLILTARRMFMAMKREVLRIGGYGQEYFVSRHWISRPWGRDHRSGNVHVRATGAGLSVDVRRGR